MELDTALTFYEDFNASEIVLQYLEEDKKILYLRTLYVH